MPAPCRRAVASTLLLLLPLLSLAASSGSGIYPAAGSDELLVCAVQCTCVGTAVDCSRQQLAVVPGDIAVYANVLDLSVNNLSYLPERGFIRYRHLEELNLASNRIANLNADVFHGLAKLRLLNLRGNNLTSVPWHSLQELHALQELLLGNNFIGSISTEDFRGLVGLKTLMLDGNQLASIPGEALQELSSLEVLSFADNNILTVDDNLFINITSLQALGLASNQIDSVSVDAFRGLVSLEILELQHNRLKSIPVAIQNLPSLRKLSVAFNQISHVGNDIFSKNPSLVHADLLGNPVSVVEKHVFTNLTQLKILIIPEAKELWEFPDLRGATSLEFLRIDRARIRHVPRDLCHVSRKLKTLDLKSNALEFVPQVSACVHLRQLQLSGNRIRSIEGGLFRHQELLHDLLLSNNHIEAIPADVFIGLHKLEILNLLGNRIKFIHHDAFLPLKQLVYLNVAENTFPQLPAHGLEHVRQLLAHNNAHLRQFPPAAAFPHAHTLRLAYAYHCCQFAGGATVAGGGAAGGGAGGAGGGGAGGRADLPLDLQETVLWLPKDKVDLSLWAANTSDLWPAYQNLTHKFGDLAEDLWGSLSPDYAYPSNLPQVVEDYFEEARAHNYQRMGHTVTCTPQPGPFMPCEDLFDWWTLRCGIWIVFLLAMLGNGAVVFVLVFSRTKMDVPRFLVCNLAGADFCMGVYLGFLAVVDASTLGNFKMHALHWQFSGACQTAGFLGVLSSELSVYTLAVITLERNYAITHAMHLNKRLSLKHAAYIMLGGWSFAVLTAALPLLGVSDYRKFAICLPFDIEATRSLAYVVFLMAVNGLAFLILMGCYLKMYCAIRGSQAWNSNDSRIAKRMALLVFTDFVCWAPIAFFSLTAAFGLQLVTLEEAKVFAIFVLPLNSCANPFLYAILTKQFKKDCVLICKAIEESRVTRGIGRCRHSSNFSNRQTPANTNSAVERNSHNGAQVACSCSRGAAAAANVAAAAGAAAGGGGGSCDTTRTPDVNVPRARRRRWDWSGLRALLCATGVEGGVAGGDSANDYTYAIAEIQKNQQKHSRNMSVSSDNFSSSRSDSWRQKSIPLRMLEKGGAAGTAGQGAGGGGGGGGAGGRRNSWTITRKPSQDSNLSSSRNDSSATTPSTSTWRVSRSSVSSDVSGAGSTQQRSTLANLRDRNASSNSSSGGGGGGGVGIGGVTAQTPRHQNGGAVQPASGEAPVVRFNLPRHGGEMAEETTRVPPTSARPKAKLRRQSAVYEEVATSGRTPASGGGDSNPGCLYRRLPESPAGREEKEEEGRGGGEWTVGRGRQVGDRLTTSRRLINRGLLDSSGGAGAGHALLSREGFVPRKLSTISSNSCSLNQESWSANALVGAAVAHANLLSPTEETAGFLPEPARQAEAAAERCTSLTDVVELSSADPRRAVSDAAFQRRPMQLPLRPSTQCTVGAGRRRTQTDGERKRMSQSDNVLTSLWGRQWEAPDSTTKVREWDVTAGVLDQIGGAAAAVSGNRELAMDTRILFPQARSYLEDDV